MPYPTKPKDSKLCPHQVKIKIHKQQTKEIKVVKKGESTNFENQAHSTGDGIGLQSTTGSETQHIAEDTAYHRSFQEPAIFLQGRW